MAVAQMIIRIDPQLKSQVDRLAQVEGKSVSDVVRSLLADYVQNRDIGSYIDNLWDRIGTKLRKHGHEVRDVQRIIKEVRSAK
jgi:hypothetical protein